MHAYTLGHPATILYNDNWFLHMWFWTCEDSEPFVIMTIHRYADTNLQETGVGNNHHRFILGVNGDGFFFWEINMVDSSTGTGYVWRETTTTLKVAKGWNYVGMHFDEIYDYSYIRMYLRTEFHTGA